MTHKGKHGGARKIFRLKRDRRRTRFIEIGSDFGVDHELESRICLSALFSFDVIAKQGQASLSGMGTGPSINDAGTVAFVGNFQSGAQGLFVGDGQGALTNINPSFSNDPTRSFGQAVEINDSGQVVSVDRENNGGSLWRLRTWDSTKLNSSLIYARASAAGIQPGDFDALSSYASLANDGGIAYADLNGTQWELRYTTSIVGNGSVIATLQAPQSLRPAIADGGKIVARTGPQNAVADPLIQFNSVPGSFLPITIASNSTTPGFSGEGRAAGIDSTGKVVGFYGERSDVPDPGPGIFIRVVTGPNQSSIVRIAGLSGNGVLDPGETYVDTNGNGKFDSGEVDTGPFKAFDPLARVGVSGDRVVFLATNTAGQKVLYTAQFSVFTDPATGKATVQVGELTLLAKVGGTLNVPGGGQVTVQDLNINDPINATGQVAFWAKTDQGDMIIRANELVRPVLVLPGIMGSLPRPDLFKDWLLHRGYDPQGLVLEPLTHSYDDLVQTLVNSGYVKDQDLFVANYDWRMPPGPQSDGAIDGHVSGLTGASITDSVYDYGVDYLGYWLKQAVLAWNIKHPDVVLDSVNIIAHSTGGLVARTYIQSDAYNATIPGITGHTTKLPKIDNFVMVGVPNRGASKAFNALNDNWALGLDKSDSKSYIVLSKLLKQAWLQLKGGATIQSPTSNDSFRYTDLFTNGQFDFKRFIQKYVPTIRALNATYDFLDNGGTLSNVNSNPLFSNDWLLDLNGGTDPNAFAVGLLAKPTVVYSSTVDTAAITKAETGSLTPVLYPLQNSLPSFPDSGIPWYEDFAGPHGGDGTVPTESSATPFVNDSRFVTYEFNDVHHSGLTADPRVQRTILATLGRPFTTVISTNLAVPLNLTNGLMVLGVDPVDALLVDDQGRRLGYTQATGPLSEIPNSTYFGGADGFGILSGSEPIPNHLMLTGTGSNYTVYVDGYVNGDPKGMTDSGKLAVGQTKDITLDFNPPPPTVPQIVSVTLLDHPVPNQLKIGIVFSVPMLLGAAQEAANYTVGLEGGSGLQVVSASYSDTGGLHRVILTVQGAGLVAGGNYAVRINGRNLRSALGTPVSSEGDKAAVLVVDSNSVVTVGASVGTNNISVLSKTPLGSSPPNSFVALDLNGDGIPDIASANLGISSAAISNTGTGQLVVLLGLGGGRYSDPQTYDLDPGFGALKVVSTDWNGDGKPDLVVGASVGYDPQKFYVFLNDGKGHFSKAPETPILVPNSTGFYAPAVQMFDVAVVLPSVLGPKIVAFKQGITGYGGITDQEAQIQIIGKDPFLGYSVLMTVGLGVNFTPSIFRFGDFNGDGRTDILVGGGQDPILLLATATGFAAPIEIAYDHLHSGDLEIGDVNGDGHLDIVSLHEDYSNNADVHDGVIFSVLLGDGKGGFTALPPDIIGRRGSRLVGLSDLNGDGKLDAVLTENWNDGPNGYNGYNWPDVNGLSAWVWKGDGAGHFAQPTADPTLVPEGETFGTPGTVALADVNGDGKRDVLFGGAKSGLIPTLINDGNGVLAPSTMAPVNLGSFDVWGGYGGDELRSGLAVADLNLDGVPDFVKLSRGNNHLEVFLGQGAGAFKQVATLNVDPKNGSNLGWIQVGDLNDDRIPDLVVGIGGSVAILTGLGDGTFSAPTFLQADPYTVEDGKLVDVNGDGKLDLVAAVVQSGTTYSYAVFFGDGAGNLSFNANTILPRTPGTSLIVKDFDGDGIPDILDGAGTLTLLHGNGNGTFKATAVSQVNYAPNLAVGDFNGDGHLDLVGFGTIDNGNSMFYSFLGDGTGHFVDGVSVAGPGRGYAVQLGDFNGDGNLDVALGYSGLFVPAGTPSVAIMAGDGKGNFGPAQTIDVGGQIAHSIFAYSTDSSYLAGSVTVVGSSALQFSARSYQANQNAASVSIAVTRTGDLSQSTNVNYSTADGTAKAGTDYTAKSGTLTFGVDEASKTFNIGLLHNPAVQRTRTVLLNLSSVTGTGANLGTQATATLTLQRSATAEDFDGDGKSDPAIFRPSNDLWVINYTTGGKLLTQFGDPKQGDIPVPGDYDGDGKADLAVFRPSTDIWIIQYSSGGTVIKQFGDPANGDVPIPGDYEGNGKTDLALFRAKSEDWIIRMSDGSTVIKQFGDPAHNDLPAPGDYEGIGTYDLGLFRPDSGQWIIRTSKGGTPISQFGDPLHGDIAAPGDYDGDGKTDFAIFRPSTSLFVIQYSSGGKLLTQLGDPANGDLPVAAPLASLGLIKPQGISFESISAPDHTTAPAHVDTAAIFAPWFTPGSSDDPAYLPDLTTASHIRKRHSAWLAAVDSLASEGVTRRI